MPAAGLRDFAVCGGGVGTASPRPRRGTQRGGRFYSTGLAWRGREIRAAGTKVPGSRLAPPARSEDPMRVARPVSFLTLLPLTACVLAASAAGAEAPITIAVRPSVLFAGGDVRTTIRAPRDARNRALRVVVEASEFYASSDVQLDGDAAAATHQFTWKTLPGGAYRVEAIVTRDDGETASSTSCFAVLSGDEQGDGVAARRAPATPTEIGGC
jgi:hypothetical protein